MKSWYGLILLVIPGWLLAAEPQVRLEQQLVPGDQVLIGATIELRIDLLVDTWFTDAPRLAALSLPDTLTSPPSGEAEHLNRQIDGKRFFGLRYIYRITPQRAQRYEVPALTFTVYPGQASSPVTVTSKPLAFDAKDAPANGSAQPSAGLVAGAVTFTQKLSRSHEPLRQGDSITRTLRLEAQGTQAVLLPPPDLVQIKGLKRYVAAPQIEALSDGRGGTIGGVRVDAVTYVINQAGNHRLPAIEMQWQDAAGGATHRVSVPAVDFAAGQSTYRGPFSITEDLRTLGQRGRVQISDHWLSLVAGVLLLAGLGWGVLSRGSMLRQRLRDWRARRRQRWLDSPGYAWREARRQGRQTPPRLDALYLWARRTSGKKTLSSAAQQMRHPNADRLLALLKARYGSDSNVSSAVDIEQLVPKDARIPAGHIPGATMRSALKPLNP